MNEHLASPQDEWRERLGAFMEASPDALVLVGPSGEIAFANTLAEKMFGYSPGELLGQSVDVLLPHELREAHAAQRAAMAASPERRPMGRGVAMTGQTKDGRAFPIDVSLGPILTAAGLFRLAAVRDLSERQLSEATRRQLELKIRETQKLESLGVRVGGIAHDLNNFLATILGNASLALRELPDDSPGRESIQTIELASRQASDLVAQILAFASKGRFVIQPVEMSGLVDDMLKLLRTVISKKVSLRGELSPNLPPVRADVAQIRQVVMNLLTNAADAIGNTTGTVSIRTAAVRADEAYLASRGLGDRLAPGDYVALEVSDTGCGMNQATVAQIFDPFFTTKSTGRGLGLSAVLGIVKGHNGAISIESELERGTTFTVLLPATTEAARASVPVTRMADGWRGSGLVLVVDDESGIRDLATRVLTRQGFQVISAVDGREGLDLFSRNMQHIQVVLLDLSMPQLTGEEVYREMRRLSPKVRVVLTSGYDEQEAMQPFGDDLVAFVHKPFEVDQLLAAIRVASDAPGTTTAVN